MIIATPDKVILKILYDFGKRVTLDEITGKVCEIQASGTPVYSSTEPEDVKEHVKREVDWLERLGFVKTIDELVKLSGAGGLVAAGLEWPDFVKAKMDAADAPSTRPA